MSYGCFDHAPFRESFPAQDGKIVVGMIIDAKGTHTVTAPNLVDQPHQMTTECQYSADDRYGDKACVGCTHNRKKP